MRKVLLTQEAAEELESAAVWYEQECSGLGAQFISAVESAFTLLTEDFPPLVPISGKAAKKGVKRLFLHRFPFSIIVLPGGDEIIVIAIAHQHRKPFYWADRVSTD